MKLAAALALTLTLTLLLWRSPFGPVAQLLQIKYNKAPATFGCL